MAHSHRMMLWIGLLAVLIVGWDARAAQIVFDDFSTQRTTWANDGTNYPVLYFGEDNDQINLGMSGNLWTVQGATTAGSQPNCYTGCGIYWQYAPAPYLWNGGSFPNGFMQSYIKSGTFDGTTVNRMSMKVKCDTTIQAHFNGSPSGGWNIGTYVKPHTDTDGSK